MVVSSKGTKFTYFEERDLYLHPLLRVGKTVFYTDPSSRTSQHSLAAFPFSPDLRLENKQIQST
jgi:hypothetical protein